MVARSALILFLAACFSSPALPENPLRPMLAPESLAKVERTGAEITPGPETESVVLRFPASDQPTGVVLPVPSRASDWTRFGAFSFEFASNSTIRFRLTFRSRKGETFVYVVQPFENVPVRAVIPMQFLTREYMNNRQFKGYWMSNWGNHIDMTQVESLAIHMTPNRPVTLRLSSLTLLPDAVPDEVLSDKPLVDEFGQWIGSDWPGKIRSLEELRRAWKSEDDRLVRAEDYGFSRYGGWRHRREKATGFFRAEAVGGRWWLVDPEGHLFFSVGPNCVRPREVTRVAGREKLFLRLPPSAGETADFYQHNATARYGETDTMGNWRRKAEQRLKAWGFNTIANWSDASLFDRPAVPFVTSVAVGRSAKNWHAFPDVYSKEFVAAAEAAAMAQCRKYRDERMLIGYFIGNEPRWPHRNLIDLILRDAEPTATQAFVRAYLKEHGESPESRDSLMETLSRHYFRTVCEAIRKADPNHMILGIRWAGSAPDAVMRANDVFDVVSINIYRFEPPREQIEKIHRLTRRPILLGEFHFGAAERGYAPSLVMVKNQTERGVAYQRYVEVAASMPQVVGAHYFQLYDQPVTGRFDGENYNLGFVNQQDIPYAPLVFSARNTHRRMYRVHAGDLEPLSRTAKVR